MTTVTVEMIAPFRGPIVLNRADILHANCLTTGGLTLLPMRDGTTKLITERSARDAGLIT